MIDCTDFSEGDEVIIKEFRTKIDMPARTGAWITLPVSDGAPHQVFLPYSIMEKVTPALQVGDVWRDSTGTEWYVRRQWATQGGLMIEAFESLAFVYTNAGAPGPHRPIERFFMERQPVLVRRRGDS